MTRRVLRLALLAVAAILTLIGLGMAPARAIAPTAQSAQASYVYDAPIYTTPGTASASERGPPSAGCADTTYDAVARWSHGTLAHPDGLAPPSSTTYAYPAMLGPDVPATTTTARHGVVADGKFSPVQPAAEGATAGERVTAVIGRQADTAVAKDWAGHEVLDLPADKWTLAKNDQWVQSVVERKMPVYVGSPTTWLNLWDAAAGRSTVFGRELQQFTDAGYTWDGWTMLPPGGG